VNLRAAPQAAARVVAVLPIGSEVRILARSGERLVQQGNEESWYRVEAVRGSERLAGFVWGGLLAKAAAVGAPGSGERLLVGFIGFKDGERTAEARLVRAGKIIARTGFRTIETDAAPASGYSLSARLLPAAPFSPALRLFAVRFEYGACDYANGEVLLYWSADKLGTALRALRSGNEMGSIGYQLVLPGQAEGRPNQIGLKISLSERDDEGRPVKDETSWERYRWTGSAFTKIP
jgi:hypothetical protein